MLTGTTQALFLLLITLHKKGLLDVDEIKTILSGGLIPADDFLRMLGERKNVASADVDAGV